MSLKKTTFSGIIWTLIDTFFIRALSFLAMLLLARWLGPKEFGLIGMIAVFIGLGKVISDSGMTESLIRTKNADQRDFSTLFFMNVGISLFVYSVIYFSAPAIAHFFKQEILIEVIRLYCLVFLIIAFSAIQLTLLNKNLEFKKITLINAPSTLSGIGVGLYLGYNGYGVWSIVWMYLTTEIVRSCLLWISSKWRPKLLFSKEKMRYHFGFGYKLMLSSVIHNVFQNIYNIIIGKYYSPQALGYYERSKQFATYPSATLTGVINKVTYPLLSSIQDDKEKLEYLYKKLIRVSFYFIAPLMLGTAAIAEPIFYLILGEEWLPAVIFFQILCLALMLFPVQSFNLNILKVYGRSDLFLKLELIKNGITVIAILATFSFGIIGLLWGSVIASFISLGVIMLYSSKLINYPVMSQIKDMFFTLLITGLMAIGMFIIYSFLSESNIAIQIFIPSILGIVFYLAISLIYKKSPLHDAIWLIKNRNK
ncbi:lipopolysaccharide biosynthesis protein [Brumimicrobium mesophilum]|uniref:lipopolysaccharide biosynthesis protein n=1 Tax=Brumimicrobium mesophilum TaxID=392717 RepID=UPI000D144473|nr:lipopolysaccharide biosynthesis protein [Brumimicrobium mesophilum]